MHSRTATRTPAVLSLHTRIPSLAHAHPITCTLADGRPTPTQYAGATCSTWSSTPGRPPTSATHSSLKYHRSQSVTVRGPTCLDLGLPALAVPPGEDADVNTYNGLYVFNALQFNNERSGDTQEGRMVEDTVAVNGIRVANGPAFFGTPMSTLTNLIDPSGVQSHLSDGGDGRK
eukprot:1187519-Prorocentrum_minimum.AAC.1